MAPKQTPAPVVGSTAVVPVETPPGTGPIAAVIPLLGDHAPMAMWSSFPSSTPEGKARLARLILEQSAPMPIGEVIEVEHVAVHQVTLVDDDGVESSAIRAVLATTDGRTFAAVSTGIIRSLQLLSGLYGVPPWKSGLRVKVQQLQTRRGRRTYQLVPVG